MNSNLEIILIHNEKIQSKISEFALELQAEHELKDSIFICVMNGAFMFYSDLVRRLPNTIQTDFVRVSSYGATKSSGLLDLVYKPQLRLFNKNVYIVDDILDSGSTLKFLTQYCKDAGARNIHTISLVTRKNSITLPNHYSLFSIDDEWIYGYGMDLYGSKRNIPNIMYIEQNID